MPESLYVATSGATSRMRQLDVVANNLANASTIGFKGDTMMFSTALDAAALGQPMTYVQTSGVVTNMSAGPLSPTGRDLDVAIQGEGFFVVQAPEGVRYTRAGSFLVDAQGRLATPEGHPVLGEGGPIQGGVGSLRILSGGEVIDDNDVVIGALRIEEFENVDLLEKAGGALFKAPAELAPVPVVDRRLVEGTLELSNVAPTTELARMMLLQRSFDASVRALRADDQATDRLLQEIAQ